MGQLDEHNKQQPFREHVRELRRAFMLSLFYVVFSSVVGYLVYQPIFNVLVRPYKEQLYYTTPTGAFNAIFKIAMLFGIVVSIPFLVYQIYKFIKPAIAKHAHYLTAKLLLLSAFLATCGVAFGYFVCLPSTLHFLTTAGPSDIKAIIDVNSYINFVVNYLVVLAIIFQLPLVAMIINKITPLKPAKMMKYQKYIVASGFIVSSLISPTFDPINLTLLALPIISLYQLAIAMVWFSNRKKDFVVHAESLQPEKEEVILHEAQLPAPMTPMPSFVSTTIGTVAAPIVSSLQPISPSYKKPMLIMDIYPIRSGKSGLY